MRRNLARLSASLAALVILAVPGVAEAEDLASLFHAPSAKVPPQPKRAVLFALKLKLSEGRGLARQLLDAGVEQDDAAAAARLAAGHLGEGLGGCQAKVELSQGFDGNGMKLERVELLTATGRTTIERRQGALTIAAQEGAGKTLRLV